MTEPIITQSMNSGWLEKLDDGTFKKKHPSTTASQVKLLDVDDNFTADNVEGAMRELFQSVSNGKTLVAGAITDKGIDTQPGDTFQQMANNIEDITTSDDVVHDFTDVSHWEQGAIGSDGEDAAENSYSYTIRTGSYQLPHMSITASMEEGYNIVIFYYNSVGIFISYDSQLQNGDTQSAPAGASRYRIRLRKNDNPDITPSESTVAKPSLIFSSTVDTSDATAIAGDILTGKTAYGADGKLTGTMTNRTGAVTAQARARSGTTLRFRPQPGYYGGASNNYVQYSDANFIASNIVSGKSIFGLSGTAASGVAYASGTYTPSSTTYSFTTNSGSTVSLYRLIVTGLTFKPSVIVSRYSTYDYTVYVSSGSSSRRILCDSSSRVSAEKVYSYSISEVSPVSITSTGFTLPVRRASIQYWYAFG